MDLNSTRSTQGRIAVQAALQVLIHRRSSSTIVVTNQGSSRVWPKLSSHPLDLHYNSSTMGGAVPLALGLSLAKPEMHVWVVTGDGALTMSLGSLISVVAAGVKNLSIVTLDNGLYEVTGGQRTAAAMAGVDFAMLAKSAGFSSCFEFQVLEDWTEQADKVLQSPGPRFVSLSVDPVRADDLRTSLSPIQERVRQLASTLEKKG